MTKKNPFKKESCKEKLCPLCKNQEEKEIRNFCNTNNIGYRWTCETCKIKNKNKYYEGETSRSARLRGLEHLRGFKNKREDNLLFKLKILEHPEEEVNFKMEITGLFKDALTRQANEGVRIKNNQKSEIMNSKSEFNHPPIARITVERNKFTRGTQPSPGLLD